MAYFKLFSTDDGHEPAYEYLPAGAITPKYGMALYVASGNLAVAAGANKPAYISMQEESSALVAGTKIAVVKIQPDQVWEAESSAAAAATVGASYDIESGGLAVKCGTTTNGGFTVEYTDGGNAVGHIVRGRMA